MASVYLPSVGRLVVRKANNTAASDLLVMPCECWYHGVTVESIAFRMKLKWQLQITVPEKRQITREDSGDLNFKHVGWLICGSHTQCSFPLCRPITLASHCISLLPGGQRQHAAQFGSEAESSPHAGNDASPPCSPLLPFRVTKGLTGNWKCHLI